MTRSRTAASQVLLLEIGHLAVKKRKARHYADTKILDSRNASNALRMCELVFRSST